MNQRLRKKKLTALLGVLLAVGLYAGPAQAAELPAADRQQADSSAAGTAPRAAASGIMAAAAITRVYGDGETAAAAAISYAQAIDPASLSLDSYRVPGKEILAVSVQDAPLAADGSGAGNCVVLRFAHRNTVSAEALGKPPQTDAPKQPRTNGEAPMRSNRTAPDCSLTILQVKPVRAMDGTVYPLAVTRTTQTSEPDLRGFQQYVYTDPATGCQMPYSLYLPEGYDPAEKYPLLVFIPDASANINFDKMPLVQGNGAVVWASAAEQQKHPCIVLAEQYTQDMVDQLGMMTTDANVWTKGLELAKDLILDIRSRYAVDSNRIYGTGQSQGGMANIAISDRYPDLFAAQYLVACQWNVGEMAALKDKHLWITVCEGDTKAYPAMNAAAALWQKLGTRVASGHGWDSRAAAAETVARVKQIESAQAPINYTTFAGGNHMYTWTFAYDIEPIRDWLFRQTKS